MFCNVYYLDEYDDQPCYSEDFSYIPELGTKHPRKDYYILARIQTEKWLTQRGPMIKYTLFYKPVE